MDDFVQLPSDERRVYFEQTAARLGLSAQIIEKDFWVCWSLKRLFAIDEFRDHLTFKGGTSLSKVYNVIERFSEDVDIAIERAFLGFGDDNEPEKGKSGKEQKRRIAELNETCQTTIRERLAPQLHESIATFLGDQTDWSLDADPADNDQQTLLFRYPSAIATELSPYFAASVKIELGARSDHFPVESASVRPYLCDAIPDALADSSAPVRVLSAERTFWEKATILHMLFYWPDGKQVAPRMSRHYYDVFQLSNSSIIERALTNIELLDRVAQHKSVFFKSASANYELARPGTICLVPGDKLVTDLRRDYAAMEPMFFNTPPEFDTILMRISALERRINKL